MAAAPPPIRLGIVGCGRSATELHLPVLGAAADFVVAGIAETDPVRARDISRRFAVPRVFSDFDAMLEDRSIEAVAVCTPPQSHADLAIRALAADRHVFVEKPLAATREDGRRMVEAAKRSHKVTAIGFHLRCHRLVERARHLVRSGALGEIHQVASVWTSGFQHEPSMPAWRGRRETGGGALYEIGSHHIDLIPFLLDDPISTARVVTRSGEYADESVSLQARTAQNVLVSSTFSQATAQTNEVQIFGDDGHVSFSVFRASSFRFHPRRGAQTGLASHLRQLQWLREVPEIVRIGLSGGDFYAAYRKQWTCFAAAVRGERAPASNFEDGLEALRIVAESLDSLDDPSPRGPESSPSPD